MKFTKMQGCGNDYVYVNGFQEKIPAEVKTGSGRKGETCRIIGSRPCNDTGGDCRVTCQHVRGLHKECLESGWRDRKFEYLNIVRIERGLPRQQCHLVKALTYWLLFRQG